MDRNTDITYQVCAEGGGGAVSVRDFVYLRHWELVDGVVVMRNVVSITDNTMNLDVIKFNPLTRELVVQAYILK